MIYICHQRPPFLVTIRLEQLYCNKKGAFFGITFDAHPHSGWFICLVNGKPHTWSKKVPPFQAASINYSNVFNLQYSGIFSDHGSKSSM